MLNFISSCMCISWLNALATMHGIKFYRVTEEVIRSALAAQCSVNPPLTA